MCDAAQPASVAATCSRGSSMVATGATALNAAATALESTPFGPTSIPCADTVAAAPSGGTNVRVPSGDITGAPSYQPESRSTEAAAVLDRVGAYNDVKMYSSNSGALITHAIPAGLAPKDAADPGAPCAHATLTPLAPIGLAPAVGAVVSGVEAAAASGSRFRASGGDTAAGGAAGSSRADSGGTSPGQAAAPQVAPSLGGPGAWLQKGPSDAADRAPGPGTGADTGASRAAVQSVGYAGAPSTHATPGAPLEEQLRCAILAQQQHLQQQHGLPDTQQQLLPLQQGAKGRAVGKDGQQKQAGGNAIGAALLAAIAAAARAAAAARSNAGPIQAPVGQTLPAHPLTLQAQPAALPSTSTANPAPFASVTTCMPRAALGPLVAAQHPVLAQSLIRPAIHLAAVPSPWAPTVQGVPAPGQNTLATATTTAIAVAADSSAPCQTTGAAPRSAPCGSGPAPAPGPAPSPAPTPGDDDDDDENGRDDTDLVGPVPERPDDLILCVSAARSFMWGRKAIVAAFPQATAAGGGDVTVYSRMSNGGLQPHILRLYTASTMQSMQRLTGIAPLVRQMGLKGLSRVRVTLEGGKVVLEKPDTGRSAPSGRSLGSSDPTMLRLSASDLAERHDMQVAKQAVVMLLGEAVARSSPGSVCVPVYEAPDTPGRPLGSRVSALVSFWGSEQGEVCWYLWDSQKWLARRQVAAGDCVRLQAATPPAEAVERRELTADAVVLSITHLRNGEPLQAPASGRGDGGEGEPQAGAAGGGGKRRQPGGHDRPRKGARRMGTADEEGEELQDVRQPDAIGEEEVKVGEEQSGRASAGEQSARLPAEGPRLGGGGPGGAGGGSWRLGSVDIRQSEPQEPRLEQQQSLPSVHQRIWSAAPQSGLLPSEPPLSAAPHPLQQLRELRQQQQQGMRAALPHPYAPLPPPPPPPLQQRWDGQPASALPLTQAPQQEWDGQQPDVPKAQPPQAQASRRARQDSDAQAAQLPPQQQTGQWRGTHENGVKPAQPQLPPLLPPQGSFMGAEPADPRNVRAPLRMEPTLSGRGQLPSRPLAQSGSTDVAQQLGLGPERAGPGHPARPDQRSREKPQQSQQRQEQLPPQPSDRGPFAGAFRVNPAASGGPVSDEAAVGLVVQPGRGGSDAGDGYAGRSLTAAGRPRGRRRVREERDAEDGRAAAGSEGGRRHQRRQRQQKRQEEEGEEEEDGGVAVPHGARWRQRENVEEEEEELQTEELLLRHQELQLQAQLYRDLQLEHVRQQRQYERLQQHLSGRLRGLLVKLTALLRREVAEAALPAPQPSPLPPQPRPRGAAAGQRPRGQQRAGWEPHGPDAEAATAPAPPRHAARSHPGPSGAPVGSGRSLPRADAQAPPQPMQAQRRRRPKPEEPPPWDPAIFVPGLNSDGFPLSAARLRSRATALQELPGPTQGGRRPRQRLGGQRLPAPYGNDEADGDDAYGGSYY